MNIAQTASPLVINNTTLANITRIPQAQAEPGQITVP